MQVLRRRSPRVGVLALLVIAGLLLGCSSGGNAPSSDAKKSAETPKEAPKPIIIRVSHEAPANHINNTYLEKWASLVKERTKGQVEVKIYPAGSLMKDADAIQALPTPGTLEMVVPGTGYLTTIVPAANVFQLPYVAENPEQWRKIVDPKGPVGSQIAKQAESKGVRVLAFWGVGNFPIISKKPIKTLAEVKGLKIRSIGGPVAEASLKAIGAGAMNISAPEAPGALQQGVVDALEGSFIWWQNSLIDLAKYGLDHKGFAWVGYAVLANDKFWQGLPAETRKILEDAMDEVTVEQWKQIQSIEDAAIAKIKEKGGQVYTLPLEEVEKWRAASQSVWKQFEDKIGKDIIDLAQKTAKN